MRFLGLVVAGCVALGATAEPVKTGTLIREMADLTRLGDFPSPAYKTVQFSSYDRRSSVPGGKEWFANSDGFGGEPIPNFEGVAKQPDASGIGEYIVCDVAGPGAIVREWTAAIEGTIRVELDNSGTPLFEGPAEEFLMKPYDALAKQAGIDPAIFANTFYQRNAAYCPIPFAKHCRITWIGDAKKIHFYQLGVRLYDKAAEVQTFSAADLKTFEQDIARVAGILGDPQANWEYAGGDTTKIALSAEPSKRAEVELPKGSAAIERLTLKVDAAKRDLALRQTILSIHFDGSTHGHVEAPLGDFFGVAPGVNPYNTVPFTVEPDGTMTCRFVMPYNESCTVRIENRGEQAVSVSGEAVTTKYVWDDARSMYFTARWRMDQGISVSGGEPRDIPYIVANGSGVYVGSTVFVLNPNDVPTPGGNWWGEGDEKIFVDGEQRPSTFGTGSEDYYNYAWSSPDIFVFPYCGQPRNDGPANRGYVTNLRWHVLDPLPFTTQFAFYMELFPHELNHGMAYGRIGYHYQRSGTIDDHAPITSADVAEQVLPEWMPAARGQAENTAFYQAEQVDEVRDDVMLEAGALWAGGKIYRWSPKEKSATATFTVPVKSDGNYSLHLALALDKNGGKVTVLVDGKEMGSFDLKNEHRVLSRYYDLPGIALKAGEHTIGIRADDGQKSVGVDFVGVKARK